MYKLIGSFIIFLCSTYIGFYFGEKYKNRNKQLNTLLKGLLFLNNEVIYSNTPIPEALKYVALKMEYPFKDIIFKAALKLDEGSALSIYEAFKEEYNKNLFFFNKEDLNIIKDFLLSLGESGVYGQDKLFNLTIENLKINCKSSEELAIKNVKMCRSLGMSIGAIIFIYLI